MKIEENMKISAKKNAAEAKRKAIEDKAKVDAEKRKNSYQMAQIKTKKVKVQTVDFNDIYAGITPDEITLQTDARLRYETHSKHWNEEVEKQATELEATMKKQDEDEQKLAQLYGTTDILTHRKIQTDEQRDAE
jgi:hypothetical protein